MPPLHPTPLLQAEVTGYLESRGLDLGPVLSVAPLTNGVSARVYRVTSQTRSIVVKQALSELLVDDLWQADPRRGATEAAALRLARQLDDNAVPAVLDVDTERCTLVLEAAPPSWKDWREVLMSTDDWIASGRVARFLGAFLARLHDRTWAAPTVALDFNDYASFEALRVAPFYRSIRSLHPDLGAEIDACIDELEGTRECLVHGDFSPKNILTSPRSRDSWVLDFEVAHFGASVFDAAFLAHHLLLKAIARPQSGGELLALLATFLDSYRDALAHEPSLTNLGHQTAALLLARIDGVSRVGYLTVAQRDSARRIARDALATPDSSLEVVVDLATSSIREQGARL